MRFKMKFSFILIVKMDPDPCLATIQDVRTCIYKADCNIYHLCSINFSQVSQFH